MQALARTAQRLRWGRTRTYARYAAIGLTAACCSGFFFTADTARSPSFQDLTYTYRRLTIGGESEKEARDAVANSGQDWNEFFMALGKAGALGDYWQLVIFPPILYGTWAMICGM